MAQEANSWDPSSILGRDTSFDVPKSSCLLSGPGLQPDSRYTDAGLAKPLDQITGRHSVFSWNEERQQAFEDIKSALITSVTGIRLESGAREETGRFRDVKRCVATEDRTRVSGISLLRHNRWTTAARYHRCAPQSFWRVSGFLLQYWRKDPWEEVCQISRPMH